MEVVVKKRSLFVRISCGVYVLILSLLTLSLFSKLAQLEQSSSWSKDDHDVLLVAPPLSQPQARSNRTNVAYAVTITDCGERNEQEGMHPFPITEGAAVLKHSIHVMAKRYGYQLYAIYHPNAQACVEPLADLGYILLKRETPVKVEEIQGDFLREKIVSNGCCGEKELIKFEAFTLVQHPVVVILDLDFLILKPIDSLFDFLLHGTPLTSDHLMPNSTETTTTTRKDGVWVLHTFDYAMVSPSRTVKPVQGGFVVIKPNQTIYQEILEIVKEGDYQERGWAGLTGKFWGSMTFQGLMTYYFRILHAGHAVELNWCAHNNMASNPKTSKGKCYDTRLKGGACEDCRTRSIDTIYSAHFTVCQKPWLCMRHHQPGGYHPLCRALHHRWFETRSALERSWGRSGRGTAGEGGDADHFVGYCSRYGRAGYQFIEKPYGGKRQE